MGHPAHAAWASRRDSPRSGSRSSGPTTIEEVARLYVEAGADLVTTDTFGGTSFRLKLHGLDGERERINRQAVEAVKRAVAGRALVSASVGPSGQLLEPFGDTSPDAVEEAFAEQIETLAAAGADVLCIETMSDLTEATRAVKAAKAVAPRRARDGDHDLRAHAAGLLHGDGRERRAGGRRPRGGGRRRRRLELRHGHRGHGRDRRVDGARHAAADPHPAERRPAGEPRRGRWSTTRPPETMAARVPELLDLGVAIVGGCCGTTPEHIRAIRRAVDAWRAKPRPA